MLGSIPIQFHAAPGHTNDSMIVHVPGYMMTGDFLFNGEGGVGRDDLPSGRVHVHWDALSVLDRFEGHTIVCSGHDPPGTTMMSLDWNRANNPILSMTSFETFRAWQEATAAKLGGVSKIKTAIPANLFENCQRPSRGSSELISSVGSSALWCLWEWWGGFAILQTSFAGGWLNPRSRDVHPCPFSTLKSIRPLERVKS